jgi:hypothetical protein
MPSVSSSPARRYGHSPVLSRIAIKLSAMEARAKENQKPNKPKHKIGSKVLQGTSGVGKR